MQEDFVLRNIDYIIIQEEFYTRNIYYIFMRKVLLIREIDIHFSFLNFFCLVVKMYIVNAIAYFV